ncbi:hypothetical protein [Poriferisphaera corsica]|nr:hypothetical protein [Poriferisphaera corsica]
MSIDSQEKTSAQTLKKMNAGLALGSNETIVIYKVSASYAKPPSNDSTLTPSDLSKPAKVTKSTQPQTEPYDIDYSSTLPDETENKKIENTAGEMMKELPVRRKSKALYAVSKAITISAAAQLANSDFENTVNKTSVVLGYFGAFAVGTLLCTRITFGEQVSHIDEDNNTTDLVRVTFEFEKDSENLHLHKYQSLGFHEKDNDPESESGLKPIPHTKNLPNGWPLNEDGSKKDKVSDFGHMMVRAPQPYVSWSTISSMLV